MSDIVSTVDLEDDVQEFLQLGIDLLSESDRFLDKLQYGLSGEEIEDKINPGKIKDLKRSIASTRTAMDTMIRQVEQLGEVLL